MLFRLPFLVVLLVLLYGFDMVFFMIYKRIRWYLSVYDGYNWNTHTDTHCADGMGKWKITHDMRYRRMSLGFISSRGSHFFSLMLSCTDALCPLVASWLFVWCCWFGGGVSATYISYDCNMFNAKISVEPIVIFSFYYQRSTKPGRMERETERWRDRNGKRRNEGKKMALEERRKSKTMGTWSEI